MARAVAAVVITFNLPMAEYQAIPALSASMASALVNECPLRAWTDSPFNPSYVAENKREFDIGTAAHLAVLEPDQLSDRVVLHEFADYKSKDARAIRDQAWIDGKTPLKPAEWAMVEAMAARLAPTTTIGRAFQNGASEVTLRWEWNGVPCKARPDFLAADNSYIADLKTAASANPRAVARKAYSEDWFVRAAWYLGGVAAVTGRRPDHYWFIVVEKEPPYIAEIYELDDRSLAWGEQVIGRALALFADCAKSGVWPGYCGKPTTLSLPSYAEFQMAEREEAGEFRRISAADARRSMQWLEP